MRARWALLLALTALAVACTEPPLPDGPAELEAEAVDEVPTDEPDPARDELADTLAALVATVEAVAADLESAARATDVDGARAAADEALRRLLHDPDADLSDGLPLLPSTTRERETTADASDGLSTALAQARDVGGATGTATVDVLREQLAGDLGAWERDAAGMVAEVEAVATSTRDLDQLEEAVLELGGEATRALAWTLLAAEEEDLDRLQLYAHRGAAHLGLAASALDDLRTELDG